MADTRADPESNQAAQPSPASPTPASPEAKNAYLLSFEPGDPADPKNFSNLKKLWFCIIMSMLCFLGLFSTSVMAPAEPVLAVYLDVSIELTSLVAAIYLCGLALGPMIWAPLSELYGRRMAMLPATFVMGVFSIGTAVSKNLASILVTRFFQGVFASAATSIGPATLGDILSPQIRGMAMAIWMECVIAGPTLAPLIGAAVTVNKHMGWRWTAYIEAIVVFFIFAVALLTMPETYAPRILRQRAKRITKDKGSDNLNLQTKPTSNSIKSVFSVHLSRPIRMVLTEPILVVISVYVSFVYAIPFMVFQFFPIVFLQDRHWKPVVSTLPFLSIFIGSLGGTAINVASQPWYVKAMKQNGGKAVPEARLPPIVVGAGLLTTGLFWFGWTANPSISWVSPAFAAGFIGAGFTIAFQQCLNFLVDLYGQYAASAISINTLMRSIMAAALTLAARPMFLNLGVGRACSTLGGISYIAFPIPFFLIKYGTSIRKLSKFAPPPQ